MAKAATKLSVGHCTRIGQLVDICSKNKITAGVKYLGPVNGKANHKHKSEFVIGRLTIQDAGGFYHFRHRAFGKDGVRVPSTSGKSQPAEYLIIIDFKTMRAD